MKYPGVYMLGKNSHAEVYQWLSQDTGQHQDAGAKAVPSCYQIQHLELQVNQLARILVGQHIVVCCMWRKVQLGVKSNVRCDALLLDDNSRTDTYPYVEVNEDDATISHEATVGKIGDEQIFYLMSRGFTESDASLADRWWIYGTISLRELPMEYAVELNRLVKWRWKAQ